MACLALWLSVLFVALSLATCDISTKSVKRGKASLSSCKSNRRDKRVSTRHSSLGDVQANESENNVYVEAVTVQSKAQDSLFSRMGPDGERLLTVWGLLLAGSVARSAAATAVHPLNVMKIMLQRREGVMPEFTWDGLMRGCGSQLLWSLPHGAFSFTVIENTKKQLSHWNQKLELEKVIPKHLLTPLMDFLSSCVSTLICSLISTPQMVTTDRIMANVYRNLPQAVQHIFETEGIRGFYTGLLPALLQKIPSYALTWMLFQQLKLAFKRVNDRAGTALENTLLGSCAAAGACCIMIPIDTIKTRIVTQHPGEERVYTGVLQTFLKILNSEGAGAFYRALPPRLLAVVPMIGIQFSIYEGMKKALLGAPPDKKCR